MNLKYVNKFWVMALLLAGLIAGCCGSSAVPPGIGGTVLPAVVASGPACGATQVALNGKITVTFNKTMNPATINGTTFTVTGPGATPVAGTVTYDPTSNVATFSPAANLAPNTAFTITVSTGVQDTVGNSPAASFVCGFTTLALPRVIASTPACGAVAVPGNIPSITVTFSKAMDPTTINTATFTLTGAGGVPVAGAVTYNAATNTASFAPAVALAANTVFTYTITTGARDTGGNALAASYVCSFTTGPPPVAPTVSTINPVCGATNVALNQKINVGFSQAMDPATINNTTFLVTGPGGAAVAGAVTYSPLGNVATFTPAANLAASTLYTVTITTGAKNLAGTALASNFVCTFTTGLGPDVTPPTVISTTPACGATLVALNTKVTANFSEALDPTTVNAGTFTLTGPGATPVAGAVTYAAASNSAVFTPSANLAPSTIYTLTLTTGVKDLAGNALAANFTCTFTTGPAPDVIPPTVISTNPACGAIGVAINQAFSATFSEALDPTTVNTTTFTLTGPGATPVTGTVTYNAASMIATFTPTAALAPNTTFTATITTGVRDLAGNALVANFVCTFTTAAVVAPAPVNLGTAATFGVLGGSAGITNMGILTVINGDIGTTGVSTLITGFHDAGPGCTYTETPLNIGTVNGKIYTAPPPPTVGCPTEGTAATLAIATKALADANVAYLATSPANMPPTVPAQGGELGNLVLPPGIYQSAPGTFAITAGDLTLDAKGDPNAFWVFQMGTSLTVGVAGTPRSVILVNGAQAKNVFWHVGTAATINGTGGGVMVGTIIAPAGITFSTAGNVVITTLNGRALSLVASVTMVNTVINVPAP